MHICFIVPGYPIKGDPTMTFVRDLVSEIAKLNIKCSVIAPQSLTRSIINKLPIRKKSWKDFVDEKHFVNVYQPFYFSFSNFCESIDERLWLFAAKKTLRKMKEPVDFFYAHFWHFGYKAAQLNVDCPLIVASGESKISLLEKKKLSDLNLMYKKLVGVVYVGTKNYKESLDLGLQQNTPYIIAPNGYNCREFFPKDKLEIRKKFKFPLDKFIVSFVGFFYSRKGIDRLNEALKILNSQNEEIYSIFIGAGEIVPDCDNILFCGKLNHSEICDYLNASDVFVLPTLAEGCCNAIVEAEACGLPIISSKEIFNDDILDEDNSIRIDSSSVDEIVYAIKQLKNNPQLCDSLSKGSLRKSKELMLQNRAKKIVDFIEKCVNNND